MNPSDREKIQKNLMHLSKHINLSRLSEELVRREIIDRDDVMRIKTKFLTEPEQNQEFFLFYTKRGPDAYSILIDALKATGHLSEAILLLHEQDPNAELSPVSPGSFSIGRENGTGSDDIMVSSITSLTLPSPTTGAAGFKIGGGGVVPIDSALSNYVFERPAIKVDVTKASIYNQGKTTRVYQMMSKPRGFCLIINNITFPGDPKSTRTGADNDTENLSQLFTAFGFIVSTYYNVKKTELLDPETGILKIFLDQFSGETKVDACFVALMSHGSKSLLRTSDPMVPDNIHANHVDIYEDILYRFNNRNCHALMGKPKMFLVQACRGKHHDRGVRRTQTDGKKLAEQFLQDMSEWESDYLPDRYPEMEDFLICNSTVHGYVSNRDTDRGSWYVECFCQVFMEMAHNTEILSMLKEVAIMMRNIQSELGEKQMCNFDNTGFFNDLYFNPGLYANPDVEEDAVPGSSTS